MKPIAHSILGLFLTCLATSASCEVLHVREDGSGGWDSIYDAIEAAEDGDVVRIHPGFYDESVGEESLRNVFKRDMDIEVVGDGADLVTVTGLTMNFIRSRSRCEGIRFQGPGPVVFTQDAEVEIVSCHFVDIVGELFGAVKSIRDMLRVDDCVFRNCYGPVGGGAITAGPLTVSNSTFVGCSGDQAGAIWGQDVIIRDSTIWNCTSSGGGIIDVGAQITIENSTIWGNTTPRAAVLAEYTIELYSINVSNSIIGATDGGYGIESNSAATLTCVAIYETDPWSVFGLITSGITFEDPLFCDAEAGDFGLTPESPCAPGGVEGCDLIGREGIGCGATPVVHQSWGKTKARFLKP